MQVRVVAVPEKRLRVRGEDVNVDVRDDGHLVVTADRGQHRANARVGEGRSHISSTRFGTRTELSRGRVFDWDQAGRLGQPAHRLLVQSRRNRGCCEGRREHGDPISWTSFG